MNVMVQAVVSLVLLLGVGFALVAPALLSNPGADLSVPSSSETTVDDDEEDGDS